MRKNNKNNKNNSDKNSNNNSNIDINAINATRYNIDNSEFFNNEQQESVVTVDMSRVTKIDVMSMSRIAFFRKAVKSFLTFDQIAHYDFTFYNKTNDRSKTRHADKYNNNELNNDYVRMRTAKQLRDVLKETAIVSFLKQHSIVAATVSEYKSKSLMLLALQK